MVDVDLLGVIRLWSHRGMLAMQEIARCTGLSRNTGRKYLASEEAEPKYSRRTSPSKLDAYCRDLIELAEARVAPPPAGEGSGVAYFKVKAK